MRIVAPVLFSIAVSSGGFALAQDELAGRERAGDSPAQDTTEEVVVRGRRLTDLRFEVQASREQAYAIFNEINSNNDFDVYCREEGRTGTRSTERVCRAQFENRISATAAREYMAAIFTLCQPNSDGFVDTQACMFGGPGQAGKSAAQGIEGQLPTMRDQMTEEIFRLAREDDRFAQAILDWYEANEQYEAARKRRDD